MKEGTIRNVEPIAIVGIGCRFPGGADDARSFWSLLVEGRSGIGDVPADRWNVDRFYHPHAAAAGAMVMRRGGFIDHLATFDAAFWGLSPREAVRMDPQQRWLLEVAWEAIEDAGTAPSRIRGRRIGVFIGMSGNDYGGLQLRSTEDVDAYTNSGSTASIAANRLSYMLDLRGPSVSLDTACSSSLVAVSVACDNLWSGQCEGALAGGVSALISPQTSVGFSKASMISPTGECFAFDARANGFVRAEGAGVVFLKPLSAALAAGDRIYALVRAAVVNQDGHTSSMTVPGLEGQAAMLEDAYRQARISPASVAYVEAHGTGTAVGDPIEAAALGRVLGRDRSPGSKCLIGSVKTNIGHLESGSGIAGLIKAALVLHHRTVPATLNYERPNPNIPFDDLRLEVASETRPLPESGGRAPVVAVNSFGFGGTNAHAVLEAAPAQTPRHEATAPGPAADRPHLLPISARDENALREYVHRYRGVLADASLSLADVCGSAGDRKEHHQHRLVIIGRSREELRRRAATWLRDASADGVVAGRPGAHAAPVFVFAGQGPQWWAMGRQLLAREPVFRDAMREIDAAVQRIAAWSVLTEMLRSEDESRIDHTDIAQPAIFALQVSLVALWKSWGVQPAKAIGHSVGEVAAAYCAGVYSLDDAVRIITTRARLQHQAFGGGRMLAVAVSRDEARAAIGTNTGVELAAINGPRLMTLAGKVASLEQIDRELQRSGVFTRWLRGYYAFHSAQMDPIRGELLDALQVIAPRRERIPLLSTVTGAPIAGESLDASYWWRNIRQAVLFGPGVEGAIDAGDRTFLEVSPHPVLESSIKECLAARGQTGAVCHSLRREVDDSDELAANLASLHIAGTVVDWTAVNRGSGRSSPQPRYPWSRERFWSESADSARLRLGPLPHPLLGQRLESAVPTWQVLLDLWRLPYLEDHCVWDTVVFPAAGYLEIGLALGRLLFAGEPHAIEQLDIKKALFLAKDQPVTLQIVFTGEDKSFAVYSGAKAGDAWELHAQGSLTRLATSEPATISLETLRARLDHHMDHGAYCQELARRGFQFGPAFRQVRNLWRSGAEVLVEVEPPRELASAGGYVFHPAILDACFHACIARPASSGEEAALYLPQSVRRLHLYRETTSPRLWAHAAAVSSDGASLESDIFVYDERGERIADVLGFRMEAVTRHTQLNPLDDCYYHFGWEAHRLRGSGLQEECDLASNSEIARTVVAALPDVERRHGLAEYYRGFVPEAESVVSLLVERALAELGWRPQIGERFDVDSLVASLGVAAEYHRVTRRLLPDLERTGVVCSVGHETWEVSRLPDGSDAEAALDRLAARYPFAAAEIDLFRRTGLNLAAILTGDTDPLELLFPAASPDVMERFYAEALGFPAHLELTRRAIERSIASLPPRRALRVLEVGAGTGVLTRTVLPILPAQRTEYLLTDVGAGFIAAARKRFSDAPFIDYHVFDLEIDPERQQVPTGHFDLVLGADVVHATSDLRVALSHLRQCLAPGGLLVLLELAKPDFVRDDVTFGLLRGYSRFQDTDVRPHSALASPAQWRQVFTESGFSDIETVDCSIDPGVAEHAIILGSAPAALPADSAGADTVQPSHYVLLADRGGVADALAGELRTRGHHADVVSSAGTEEEGLRLIGETAASGALAGVIHCCSLDHPAASDMTVDQLRAAQTNGLLSAVQLISSAADSDTRMWFVTRHAQRVTATDMVDGLASAPLIGMLRVANNEHQCRFSAIDLEHCSPDAAATLLADEVTLASDGEFEIAYRGDVRHVLRLQRVRTEQLSQRTFNARGAGGSVAPFQLQTRGAGILAHLALHETERPAPGPTEVEVRVRAAGINFRDIMKALGTHPGNPPELLWFGDDVAGTVERVGALVADLQPGDEVAGMAPYAFRSYVRTDPRMLFRKPADLSFAQAAAIPTIFLTAHYAINHLARMQAGESILIHAGTGGVGQAAIQIAQHLSLEIFATAGTPEKRRLLTEMGVDHVMSSRTLEFADEVMRATGGRGVDAVLNSLAGEFIPRSLSVLAPFGRFLEIGKVDIYRNARIGLHSLRNNVSCFVIDLTQHLRDKRDLVVQMFAEIAARFAAGDYRPVPQSTFPITEAVEAFRFMAQGKHVGKNVLTFDHEVIPIAFTTDSAQRFRRDATYLITGGAGGFGLETARWIARHGGRHLALMSRSGPREAAARAMIEELRGEGVTVLDVRGDVTRADDVRDVVDRIGRNLPPLKGVFHAAMVLDDDLITELDEERMWNALEPKMAGAWNLHIATERLPLEHFVCCSSFSAVIGMLRQSNYNAGNAFLDALAQYRRARNLPALSISWGAIRGAGFVERDQKTAEVLAKLGFGSFQKGEALRVLDDLLVRDSAHIVAAPVDWSAVLKLSPLVAASRTYTALTRDTAVAERAGSLDAQLRAASADDQERLLAHFIAAQVAGVFGTVEDKIDRSARLTDLGLDSLMTLELTNRVERELGIRLPVSTLLSGPTIVELARNVRQLLAPALGGTSAAVRDASEASQPELPAAEAAARSIATAETRASWLDDPQDHLVVIKNGSDVPIFCFHPVGGGVGIYAGLSPHLPRELPLIGVESRLLRGATAEYQTLHDMVEAYVAAVRGAHAGPYRLLGFSLGGYLAARVAEVLDALGAQVEFVGVIDWDARQKVTPDAQREALVRLSIASYMFLQQEMGMLRPRPEQQLRAEISALVDAVANESAGGGDAFFRWVRDNELTTSQALEELARQYLVRFEQHCRLLTRGLPRPDVRAPLIVWRASEGFGSGLESWERRAGWAREHVVSGDHDALMRPAVLEQVAGQLMDFLQACDPVRLAAPDNAVQPA